MSKIQKFIAMKLRKLKSAKFYSCEIKWAYNCSFNICDITCQNQTNVIKIGC